MRYRAVAFDFDYTLGDSTDGIMMCVSHALESMGLPVPDIDTVRRSIGHPLDVVYRMYTGDDDPGNAELFSKHFIDKADRTMTETAVLYPDAIPLLEALKREGIPTAVVTSKFRRRVDAILELRGATHLVDAVVGSDDVTHPKPDPEGLFLAARLMGVRPEEMLYVGDTLVDADAAASAGVDFAAVLTGYGPEGRFDGCGAVTVEKDLTGIRRFLGLR